MYSQLISYQKRFHGLKNGPIELIYTTSMPIRIIFIVCYFQPSCPYLLISLTLLPLCNALYMLAFIIIFCFCLSSSSLFPDPHRNYLFYSALCSSLLLCKSLFASTISPCISLNLLISRWGLLSCFSLICIISTQVYSLLPDLLHI